MHIYIHIHTYTTSSTTTTTHHHPHHPHHRGQGGTDTFIYIHIQLLPPPPPPTTTHHHPHHPHHRGEGGTGALLYRPITMGWGGGGYLAMLAHIYTWCIVYRFVFFCVGTKTLWLLSRLHSCVVFVICLGALLWCKKVGGCIMSQSMSFRCLVLNMLCQPRFQNVVERDYTPVRAHNRHSGRNFGKMVLRAIPTTESHVKPFLFHY